MSLEVTVAVVGAAAALIGALLTKINCKTWEDENGRHFMSGCLEKDLGAVQTKVVTLNNTQILLVYPSQYD